MGAVCSFNPPPPLIEVDHRLIPDPSYRYPRSRSCSSSRSRTRTPRYPYPYNSYYPEYYPTELPHPAGRWGVGAGLRGDDLRLGRWGRGLGGRGAGGGALDRVGDRANEALFRDYARRAAAGQHPYYPPAYANGATGMPAQQVAVDGNGMRLATPAPGTPGGAGRFSPVHADAAPAAYAQYRPQNVNERGVGVGGGGLGWGNDGDPFLDACLCTKQCTCRKGNRVLHRTRKGDGTTVEGETRYVLKDDVGRDCDKRGLGGQYKAGKKGRERRRMGKKLSWDDEEDEDDDEDEEDCGRGRGRARERRSGKAKDECRETNLRVENLGAEMQERLQDLGDGMHQIMAMQARPLKRRGGYKPRRPLHQGLGLGRYPPPPGAGAGAGIGDEFGEDDFDEDDMFDDEDDEFGGDVGMGMGGAVPPGGRGGMGRVGPRRGAYDPRRLNGGGVRNPRCGGGGFGSMDTPDRRSGMRNGRPDRPSRRPGGGGRRPMPADGMQSGDWPPPGGGGSENWETQASGF